MTLNEVMPPSGNLAAPKSTESVKNYRQMNSNITNSFCPQFTKEDIND